MIDSIYGKDYFDYKDVEFIKWDMTMWLCPSKSKWLINTFGTWKTIVYSRIAKQSIYTSYNSFEDACDAIVNSNPGMLNAER